MSQTSARWRIRITRAPGARQLVLQRRTIGRFQYPVQSCVFTDDGRVIIAAACKLNDPTLNVPFQEFEIAAWDLNPGRQIYRSQRKLRSQVFSANGRYAGSDEVSDSGSVLLLRDAVSDRVVCSSPSTSGPTLSHNGLQGCVTPDDNHGRTVGYTKLPAGEVTI